LDGVPAPHGGQDEQTIQRARIDFIRRAPQ